MQKVSAKVGVYTLSSSFLSNYIANKKLAEINSELAKTQEHAKRFQDLLAVERRKQKILQVHSTQQTHTH